MPSHSAVVVWLAQDAGRTCTCAQQHDCVVMGGQARASGVCERAAGDSFPHAWHTRACRALAASCFVAEAIGLSRAITKALWRSLVRVRACVGSVDCVVTGMGCEHRTRKHTRAHRGGAGRIAGSRRLRESVVRLTNRLLEMCKNGDGNLCCKMSLVCIVITGDTTMVWKGVGSRHLLLFCFECVNLY